MEAATNRPGACFARLTRYGLLSVTGDDARAFLHAQLTTDIANLPPGRATLAGWCTAKGRLLASLIVIPAGGGFLLQVARDIAPAVAKRLSMFVLRSKVRVADASAAWSQFGAWGPETPARLARLALDVGPEAFGVARTDGIFAVRHGPQRYLVIASDEESAKVQHALEGTEMAEDAWRLEEIRAGRPFISGATQDQFVPQMVNLEALGGVDFRKGCYPGQEIVARAQYRGQVKRRMVRAIAAPGSPLAPGQDLFCDDHPGQPCGTVVDAATGPEGVELLAVLPLDASAVRTGPGGELLRLLQG